MWIQTRLSAVAQPFVLPSTSPSSPRLRAAGTGTASTSRESLSICSPKSQLIAPPNLCSCAKTFSLHPSRPPRGHRKLGSGLCSGVRGSWEGRKARMLPNPFVGGDRPASTPPNGTTSSWNLAAPKRMTYLAPWRVIVPLIHPPALDTPLSQYGTSRRARSLST
jgi:hypothetical protein